MFDLMNASDLLFFCCCFDENENRNLIDLYAHFCIYFFFLSYYSSEVDSYSSQYGYSQSVATPQTIGYDISADFVDSTTAYEPRNNTIIDADFIGMHSMYTICFSLFLFVFFLSSQIMWRSLFNSAFHLDAN